MTRMRRAKMARQMLIGHAVQSACRRYLTLQRDTRYRIGTWWRRDGPTAKLSKRRGGVLLPRVCSAAAIPAGVLHERRQVLAARRRLYLRVETAAVPAGVLNNAREVLFLLLGFRNKSEVP